MTTIPLHQHFLTPIFNKEFHLFCSGTSHNSMLQGTISTHFHEKHCSRALLFRRTSKKQFEPTKRSFYSTMQNSRTAIIGQEEELIATNIQSYLHHLVRRTVARCERKKRAFHPSSPNAHEGSLLSLIGDCIRAEDVK